MTTDPSTNPTPAIAKKKDRRLFYASIGFGGLFCLCLIASIVAANCGPSPEELAERATQEKAAAAERATRERAAAVEAAEWQQAYEAERERRWAAEKVAAEKDAAEKAAAEKAAAIEIRTVFKDYDENEVAADTKYRGKRLVFTGTVQGINRGPLDDIYITMACPNQFLAPQAYFADSDRAAISELRKGHKIYFEGEVTGMTMGTVFIKKCKLR